MQTNTMAMKRSSGCGCSGGGANSVAKKSAGGGAGCGCGCSGCSECETSPAAYVRPKFFSGQLLTEDDLQSLGDYVVGKNRLHNRMLFGDGVACGLRVSIDVCDKRKLNVSSGYAIDCCGNDIVVPCATTLDVVQLVRDLRIRMLGKDCGDPCVDEMPARQTGGLDSQPARDAAREALLAAYGAVPAPAEAAGGVVGAGGGLRGQAGNLQNASPAMPSTRAKPPTYCLYVVYCEQSTDPVVPFDGEDACGGGECRETRVREGYRFELRCAPPSSCADLSGSVLGGLFRTQTGDALRVTEAVKAAAANPNQANHDRAIAVFESALQAAPIEPTAEFTADLLEARALVLTAQTRDRFLVLMMRLVYGWLIKRACIEILPQCPPCDEDGVLIACFDFENCVVSEVCNHSRKTIISPAYLAQMGLQRWWRCVLMKMCCGEGPDLPDSGKYVGQLSGRGEAIMQTLRSNSSDAVKAKEFKTFQQDLLERAQLITDPAMPEGLQTLAPRLKTMLALQPEVAAARPAANTRVTAELREEVVRLGKERAELDERHRALESELASMRKEFGDLRASMTGVAGRKKGDPA